MSIATTLRRTVLVLATLLLGALTTTRVSAAPMYNIISLGVAQTGDTSSTGLGVSPNGTYAVGFSSTSTANHPLIWTQQTGTTPLPSLAGRAFNSPTGVNN